MRLRIAGERGRRMPWGTQPALEAMAQRLAPARLRVQLVLADDVLLRRLNRAYRGRDRATDVLSFRYEASPARTVADPDAEIYVSLPRAARQAAGRGHSLAQEFVLLVLHGLLHLQGHDHHAPAEARRMHAAERRQLAWLGRRWPRLRLDPLVAGPQRPLREAR